MAESRPESEFATIADMADRLAELVKGGMGDFPVQIVIVPASTIRAIARTSGHTDDRGKPALMVELPREDNARMPVSLISADFLGPQKQSAIQ